MELQVSAYFEVKADGSGALMRFYEPRKKTFLNWSD
jgi:hypothetical protein